MLRLSTGRLLRVALVFLTIAGLPAQQAPPSGTAALSGVVSDDSTGKPLAGAVVSLTGTGDVRVSLRAVTDSKGRFVFHHLPAGTSYYFRTTKAGYVGAGLTRFNANFSVTPVSLLDGEWIPDISLVMSRPGGISGRVVDERGESLVDVPVRVLMQIPVAGTHYWGAGPVARTDDRGMYRISGLFPGTYVVGVPSVQSVVPIGTSQARVLGYTEQVGSMGGMPKVAGIERSGVWHVTNGYITPPADEHFVYPIRFYPQASTMTEATPLILKAAQEHRNVDFALSPVRAVRVSGRVIAPGPTSGLVVRLLQRDAQTLGTGSEQATALVEADGSFTLIGVPAGQYVLAAQSASASLSAAAPPLPRTPGLVLAESNSEFLPWMPSLTSMSTMTSEQKHSAMVPIDVGSEDVRGLALTLKPGSSVRGRILREDGGPFVENVTVSAFPATGDPSLASVFDRSKSRNPPGAFVLEGLAQGEYVLSVVGGGYVVKSATAQGVDYSDLPFQIESGGTHPDFTVTLTNNLAATLSGAVRSADNQPVTQAAVILFPADRRMWTRFGPNPKRIRSVLFLGSRGYQIPRLPGGDYLIVAVDSSLRDVWLDPRFFPTAASVASRVRIEWGKPAVLDLTLQRVVLK